MANAEMKKLGIFIECVLKAYPTNFQRFTVEKLSEGDQREVKTIPECPT